MTERLFINNVLCHWRAVGPYVAASASKNGLMPETELFLKAYAATRSIQTARTILINEKLPQRSRVTRALIVRTIQARLTAWNPPAWVLDELTKANEQPERDVLRSLLLLHYARQQTLAYDAIQQLIVPRWQSGELQVTREDVLAFFNEKAVHHPEISAWSYETRIKVAGNFLTTLRDFGLLTGQAIKRITEPVVDIPMVLHLRRLLLEEGIAPHRLVEHPDWKIWLLPSARVESFMNRIEQSEREEHA